MPQDWVSIYAGKDIIAKSFRLVDYEMLCKFLEGDFKLSCKDYIEYIDKILEKTGIHVIKNDRILYENISGLPDCVLTEEMIEGLFKGDIKENVF